MKRIIQFSLLLLLCLPLTALAELPEQLKADFATIEGHIIMPIGEEYLVDLDAANLHVGDILALLMPGEKVIDPVTKEVLGTLDVPKGFLQVVRIKSGYSYVTPMNTEVIPNNGDLVRRFSQVPTFFADVQGGHSDLYENLESELSQLDWLNPGDKNKALLFFTVENDKLTVTATEDILLQSYSMVAGRPAAPQMPFLQSTALSQSKPKEKFLEKTAKDILGIFSSSSRMDALLPLTGFGTVKGQGQQGVWSSPLMEGQPVGLAVNDLDSDGKQEIAIAFDKKLLIARVEQGKFLQLAEIDIPTGQQLLSLDEIDLDNNGSSELYMTAVTDGKLSSLSVEYLNSSYQLNSMGVNWFLRSIELPGEGKVLIGQIMGEEDGFYGQPFKVKREGQQLIAGEKLNLPAGVNLYNFTPFTDEDNRVLYAVLSDTDYLKVITPGGLVLWESDTYFGGTEVQFEHKTGSSVSDEEPPPVQIQTRLLHNPAGGILVAQNDGMRYFKRYRVYKNSRLVSLSWNEHTLVENWRTIDLNGYLGDYTLADADNDGEAELILAVKTKHKVLNLQSDKSALFIYELTH